MDGHARAARCRDRGTDLADRLSSHEQIKVVEVRGGDEKPAIREYYSDWYLLDRDFPEGTRRKDIDEETVLEVLQERREYPVQNDLSPYNVFELRAERITIRDAEVAEEERIDYALEEHDVPTALEALAYVDAKKPSRMLEVLRAIRDRRVRSHADIANHCSVAASTVANYVSDDGEIQTGIVKDLDVGGYELTPFGETALEVSWDDVGG